MGAFNPTRALRRVLQAPGSLPVRVLLLHLKNLASRTTISGADARLR